MVLLCNSALKSNRVTMSLTMNTFDSIAIVKVHVNSGAVGI